MVAAGAVDQPQRLLKSAHQFLEEMEDMLVTQEPHLVVVADRRPLVRAEASASLLSRQIREYD
jgi:hypothetical protein